MIWPTVETMKVFGYDKVEVNHRVVPLTFYTNAEGVKGVHGL